MVWGINQHLKVLTWERWIRVKIWGILRKSIASAPRTEIERVAMQGLKMLNRNALRSIKLKQRRTQKCTCNPDLWWSISQLALRCLVVQKLSLWCTHSIRLLILPFLWIMWTSHLFAGQPQGATTPVSPIISRGPDNLPQLLCRVLHCVEALSVFLT